MSSTNFAENRIKAADMYLSRGLSILPTTTGKKPMGEWKKFQSKRMQPEEVQNYFNSEKVEGIGIICGKVSGNLEVIDVDCKYDKTGRLFENLSDMIYDHLPEVLNSFVIVKTVNNGYHIYYRCVESAGNQKLANRPTTDQEKEQTYQKEIEEGATEERARKAADQDKIRVLIETRGEGGYVIAPPSPGYQNVGSFKTDKIPTITKEEREYIFAVCRSFDETPPTPPPEYKAIQDKKEWSGLSSFDDYNTRADVVSLLTSNGWTVVKQSGDRIHFKRPGKTDSETSGNFHISKKLFYVFSSSTCFDAGRAYNPVQVYSILECNSDYSEASKRLYDAGYGERGIISNKDNTKTPTPAKQPKPTQETPPGEYFETRTFAQVVAAGSKEPPRRKIVGAFLYEDTNSYFFSRTNYGKSLLAFQFGYAAATGKCFDPCYALRNECEPMRVLVVDLELESRDIYERHGKAINDADPELLKNLIYIHEKSNVKPVFNLELLDKIEKSAIDNKAKLIIIDNISKLLPDLLKAEDVSRVIEALKRIRQNNKASFLVIGHTTKGDPRTAISPTSYYGSAMLQNFFTELFYLDMTKDEKFFLCHSKTKRAECYNKSVPILNRSDESKTGYGFTFERLESISDVQLPLSIQNHGGRKTNLSKYRNELSMIERTGIKRTVIADLCNVDRSTITRILDG